MAYILKDNQMPGYQELWDHVPGVVRDKGFGLVRNDVFGFEMTAPESTTDEVTFIWEARQVEVDKLTGSGEEIQSGQFVYALASQNFQIVTANPTGTIGTDYYFVGVAKKNAGAADSTVLISFWGDEYNHADRAA